MKRILCSFLFMILSLIANADSSWKWVGPPGGTVAELVPDRSNPNLWFAVNNSSLYRSGDNGSTWERKQLEDVVSVSVNPLGSEVLVITGRGFHQRKIWVSHDTGKNFQLRATIPFPLRKILPHPQKRDVLYAFGFPPYDLGVSTDHGLHWKIFKNIPGEFYEDYEELEFTDFLVSPMNQEMLFASGSIVTDYHSFAISIQSSDSGNTWTVESKKYGLHWDPAFPHRAFSCSHDGIRKLTDKGWVKISNQPADELSSVPNTENVLVATRLDQHAFLPIVSTFRSNDVGKTWTKVQLDLQNNVSVLNGSSNGMLAGTQGGGIYRKNESGWRSVNTGIRESRIINVELGGDKIYGLSGIVSYQPGGRFLFKRDAETDSWSNLGFGMPLAKIAQIETIAVNPLKPDLVFALVPPSELLRSTDGGQTWSVVEGLPKRFLFGSRISFDLKQPDVVYFSRSSDPAVFRSTNGGLNFSRLPANFDLVGFPLHVLPDANNPQIIYFSSQDRGIFKSTDGGESVQLLRPFGCGEFCKNGPLDIAPLPQQDSYLVLLGRGQVMLTQNGGQSWERIGQIKGTDLGDTTKLLPMSNNGLDFIAVFNSKLFESHDGGKTWNNITAQIGTHLEILDITDPRFGPLYVGTDRGIYSRN